MGRVRHFLVTGRKKPTEADFNPKIYTMSIFAPNGVVAKSRFWYFLGMLKKMKRATGEILAVKELQEQSPNKVKNYGIWLRYYSRSGKHNMYKEYRDITLTGAVEQMYEELAGRHRARERCLQIIKTAVLEAKDCKRTNVTAFHSSTIKFPLPHRLPRAAEKKFRTTFKARMPSTYRG